MEMESGGGGPSKEEIARRQIYRRIKANQQYAPLANALPESSINRKAQKKALNPEYPTGYEVQTGPDWKSWFIIGGLAFAAAGAFSFIGIGLPKISGTGEEDLGSFSLSDEDITKMMSQDVNDISHTSLSLGLDDMRDSTIVFMNQYAQTSYYDSILENNLREVMTDNRDHVIRQPHSITFHFHDEHLDNVEVDFNPHKEGDEITFEGKDLEYSIQDGKNPFQNFLQPFNLSFHATYDDHEHLAQVDINRYEGNMELVYADSLGLAHPYLNPSYGSWLNNLHSEQTAEHP